MFKRRFIATACGILLLILGLIIDKSVGFERNYFVISFFALLIGFWLFEFVFDLVLYKKNYEYEFKIFVAEKVNKTDLSYDQIMDKRKYYYKEFKRTKLKGKLYEYFKVCFTMGLFILLVVYLFI